MGGVLRPQLLIFVSATGEGDAMSDFLTVYSRCSHDRTRPYPVVVRARADEPPALAHFIPTSRDCPASGSIAVATIWRVLLLGYASPVVVKGPDGLSWNRASLATSGAETSPSAPLAFRASIED